MMPPHLGPDTQHTSCKGEPSPQLSSLWVSTHTHTHTLSIAFQKHEQSSVLYIWDPFEIDHPFRKDLHSGFGMVSGLCTVPYPRLLCFCTRWLHRVMTSCQFEEIPHFSQQGLWEMINLECFCVMCIQPCMILAVGKLFGMRYAPWTRPI